MSVRAACVIVAAAASLLLSGCGIFGGSSGGAGFSDECQVNNPAPDRTKAEFQVPCQANSDCEYGVCHKSNQVAAFGFCTKDCSCGPNSGCSDDAKTGTGDGAGRTYTCQKFTLSGHPGETLLSFCMVVCASPADCPKDANGAAVYTRCEAISGAAPSKVCRQ